MIYISLTSIIDYLKMAQFQYTRVDNNNITVISAVASNCIDICTCCSILLNSIAPNI